MQHLHVSVGMHIFLFFVGRNSVVDLFNPRKCIFTNCQRKIAVVSAVNGFYLVGICWRTIWKQFNSGFVIERTSKRFSLVLEGLALGGSSRVRQK
jgi:hypothetical protein